MRSRATASERAAINLLPTRQQIRIRTRDKICISVACSRFVEPPWFGTRVVTHDSPLAHRFVDHWPELRSPGLGHVTLAACGGVHSRSRVVVPDGALRLCSAKGWQIVIDEQRGEQPHEVTHREAKHPHRQLRSGAAFECYGVVEETRIQDERSAKIQ